MALTDGLLVYYTLDTDGTDSLGVNNAASYNGALMNSSGKINGCASFDGVNDYMRSNSVLGIASAGTRTMSCWVKVNSWVHGRVFLTLGTYSSLKYSALTTISGNKFFFWGYGADIASTNTFSTGVWYHVVFTYDGTTGKLYVNGNLEGTNTFTLNTTNTHIKIGSDSGARPTNCYVDEVAIWNRVLLDGEIASLYNSGDGLQYPLSVTMYSINGEVSLDATPVEGAKVYLIDANTELLHDYKITDVDGLYSFDWLDNTNTYHLTVEYDDGSNKYNTLFKPFLTPIENE